MVFSARNVGGSFRGGLCKQFRKSTDNFITFAANAGTGKFDPYHDTKPVTLFVLFHQPCQLLSWLNVMGETKVVKIL